MLNFRFLSALALSLAATADAADCTRYAGLLGTEDLTLAPSGRLYASSQDWRDLKRPGFLSLLPVGTDEAPRRLKSPLPDFHPHGLSSWSEGPRDRLFVVNHPRPQSTRIEIFDSDGVSLETVASLSHPKLQSANDILALDGERFYVSNDHAGSELWQKLLEELLGQRRSGVYYFDGEELREVITGLRFANGLAFDRSRGELYVAATASKALHVYDARDPARPRWLRSQRTPGLPDNLEWDAQGRLIVALHPSKLRFLGHSLSPKRKAGSRIARWDTGGSDFETIFEDDGTRFGTASVGLAVGDELFMGSVYADGVLRCSLPKIR